MFSEETIFWHLPEFDPSDKTHIFGPSGFFKFEKLGIQFKNTKTNFFEYDDTVNNVLIVPLSYKNSPQEENTKKCLQSEFIQSNLGMKILFWCPSEGHSRDFDFVEFQKLQSIINLITFHKKYFVFGDITVEDAYNDYIEKYNPVVGFTKCFYLNYFESREETYPIVCNYKRKKKDFICLMRRHRPHRAAFYTKLLHNNLVDHGYVTFHKVGYNVKLMGIPDEVFKERKEQAFAKGISYLGNDPSKEILKLFNSVWKYKKHNISIEEDRVPVSEEHDTRRPLLEVFPPPIKEYESSRFAVVTETDMNNQFITEKTYSMLAFGIPFIVLGGHHTLKYLRELGYKTYSNMFDESYDNIKDPARRMEKVVQEIKHFTELPEEEKDKRYREALPNIRYNRMKFLSRQDEFESDFIDIIDKVNEEI